MAKSKASKSIEEIAASLRSALPTLEGKAQEIAINLLSTYNRSKRWSDPQKDLADRLANPQAAPKVDMEKVNRMFARFTTQKAVEFNSKTDGTGIPLVFRKTSETGKYSLDGPKDKKAKFGRIWYGYVHATGQWDSRGNVPNDVTEAFSRFCADPVRTAFGDF